MIVSCQLGPLQEQVLLTAEPFLHPPIIMLFWNTGSYFVAQAVLNSLWSPSWFQSHGDPPASASQVLRLQEFGCTNGLRGAEDQTQFQVHWTDTFQTEPHPSLLSLSKVYQD